MKTMDGPGDSPTAPGPLVSDIQSPLWSKTETQAGITANLDTFSPAQAERGLENSQNFCGI